MAKNLKVHMQDGSTKGIRGEVIGSLGVTSMGLVHIATGRLIPVPEGQDAQSVAEGLSALPGIWKMADTYDFGAELPETVRKPVREFFGLS